MRHARSFGILAGCVLLATAGEVPAGDGAPLPTTQYVLDLGAGGMVRPKYPGADAYILTPWPIAVVSRLYLPVLGQVADGTKAQRGVFVYPSVGFVGERNASDSADLRGTGEIDWALELGIGAGYRYDQLRGFVELRQGINGHDGQVGALGLDLVAAPADRVELSFGPRAGFASADYMETYFGVTAAEAAAGRLTAFDPDGGFKSVGVAARLSYAVSERTTLHLRGGWDRLVGDAARSPIVESGSRDQLSAGIGISHRFAFDLFR